MIELDVAALRGTRGVDLTRWPPRYDPAAGALSWQRTIAFLAGKLR